MIITAESLKSSDKVYRLNLINSITGFKPGNLIGTKSVNNQSNLAIFSSVVHLGSKPPLLGIITRPNSVPRHTYKNIIDTNYFTINHISKNSVVRAHYTSAKFDVDDSEFKRCGFEEDYINSFYAPFVKESEVKIGMKLAEEIKIRSNNTILLVGEVIKIIVDDNFIGKDGSLKYEDMNSICISGLDTYYETKMIAKYPYARREKKNKKW